MTEPEASPNSFELRVPPWLAGVLLLRIEFPELNHLPEERRREIIIRCSQVEAVQALQNRRRFWHRVCWCLSAMILVVLLLLRKFGGITDDRMFFFLITGGFLFASISMPVVFFVFQIKTRRLFHKLVAEEMAKG